MKEGSGDGQLSSGGSVGQPGVGTSTGDFVIRLKGALEVEHLTLWELCEGNLEWGSLAGDPEGFVEKALETGISSHRGPTLGNLGDGSSTGDSEMDELPPSLFEEAPWRGPGRSSFNGDPRKYFRKIAGCGHLSLRGPLCCTGNPAWGGRSYAGDFEG